MNAQRTTYTACVTAAVGSARPHLRP